VAEKIIDRAEKVIFLALDAPKNGGHWLSAAGPGGGSSLPFRPSSAISPTFIARLIKGCRVDARADYFFAEIIKHFQRSNEHFSRPGAPRERATRWPTGEPNAQAEDQIGR
jgi:hypothetical protein